MLICQPGHVTCRTRLSALRTRCAGFSPDPVSFHSNVGILSCHTSHSFRKKTAEALVTSVHLEAEWRLCRGDNERGKTEVAIPELESVFQQSQFPERFSARLIRRSPSGELHSDPLGAEGRLGDGGLRPGLRGRRHHPVGARGSAVAERSGGLRRH